jgi:hypothetical protein
VGQVRSALRDHLNDLKSFQGELADLRAELA